MKYIKFFPDGSKEWWQDNQLHRLDGPAIEYASGAKYWYQYALLHRVDGPAVEYADGTKKWYYEDTKINCTTQQEFIRLINLKVFW